jgi:hypothetical protein
LVVSKIYNGGKNKMNQFGKPILFIVFNRLDTTKKVFEQIKEVKPIKLYVASDGPRNEAEKEKVMQVRNFIINNVDWRCDIKTRFRDKNLGVGFGPNDAIDWFFSYEEEGIILEDDCLPSISFFHFCSELLDKYRNNKKIAVIQGFNPFPNKDYPYSYFFSKYDLKWGWATWRDRWQYQDMYTKDWPHIKKTDFLDRIAKDNVVKSFWTSIFEQVHRNPSIAWDTQFTYQLFKKNLLTITPKQNLILNIGYGKGATNTTWIPVHLKELKLEELDFPLIHPEDIKINEEYDKLIEKVQFNINHLSVLRRKFRNFLESNKFLRDNFLPLLLYLYRSYKKLKG